MSSKDGLASIFKSTEANKWYKSIKAWDYYVTMMFAVLSGCTYFNEIVMGLGAFEGKHIHVGLEKVLLRSTLADANKNRSSTVFSKIYEYLSTYY